ncbi:hypothetical protein AZG88_06080 [Rhodococcus sp. LB1]|nr:hypothetical protein AZG88_06080 [Rhodococcus sp. LB1]
MSISGIRAYGFARCSHVVQPAELPARSGGHGLESVASIRKRNYFEATNAAQLDRILLSEVRNGS